MDCCGGGGGGGGGNPPPPKPPNPCPKAGPDKAVAPNIVAATPATDHIRAYFVILNLPILGVNYSNEEQGNIKVKGLLCDHKCEKE
jgi:hypothetical protein